MGVPVVTLRGERHAARVGASLLGQAGLPDLIAGAAEDYVAIASALASDPERLASLRSSLRRRCPQHGSRLPDDVAALVRDAGMTGELWFPRV
jgi:predicted O-linked N-acetylglucosamine transferase (SPINDLY family)